MSIYDFNVTTIDGDNTTLEKYKDKVMLIVNVASECGFTSQYKGLQALHEKYADKGLAVLGFPCNQFRNQEPATEAQIKIFCTTNYNVSFDMFSKIEVNGDNAHPLYKYLKSEASGLLGSESIKWNFTKFLVNKKGEVVERYGSMTTPKELEKEIEELLKLNG
ncbi:MAG TPA: glutathione peroxidase [Campylobacterales bacterium]|nr:glutathione peroxidase [Campylobacterales bacterium]